VKVNFFTASEINDGAKWGETAMRLASRCGPLSDVLRAGFQRADEGDLSVLLKLGLPLPLIRKIQNLSLRKHNRVCDLLSAHLGNLLSQELGNEQQQQRLEGILAHVDREDFNEMEQDELILSKAPREMMNCLAGMTYQDFATRRAMLGVAGTGRPRKVSDKQQQAIWASWCANAGLSHAQRFLKVVQETKLDLRTLWPVLRPALETPKARPSGPQHSAYRRTSTTEVSEIYQQP
jgi:hypothetical protein